MTTHNHPAVLTIAGSDPSGGAGIQADLKTFTAFGCYGASVLTALTAQNTTGVKSVHAPPPEFVGEQLRSVLEDTPIRAMKTGMLYDGDTIRTIAGILRSHYNTSSDLPPIVCDPVCISTSGHPLLREDALDTLIDELFPLTGLITPNKMEATALLERRGLASEITTLEQMIGRARALLGLGPRAVLLKGGHLVVTEDDVQRVLELRPDLEIIRDGGLLEDNMEILSVSLPTDKPSELVVDLLSQKDGQDMLFLRPRIDSTSTHGTGCTLSAAIAASLARGGSFVDAIKSATAYTHLGIIHAFPTGNGFGPLNHMHNITTRTLPLPTPFSPRPLTRYLIDSTMPVWRAYVQHEFVKQLGKGTLRKESFLHFIKQDYHYLRYYARAYGLLVSKAQTFGAMGAAVQTISNILSEISTHKAFSAKWGITEAELEAAPESLATTAYGAYLLDVGLHGDYTKLVMAAAACLLGYGEVGLWLTREARRPNTWVMTVDNPYQRWIDDYSGRRYQEAVRSGLDLIEACAVADPPSAARLSEWRGVWERCTRFETAFWDMGLNLS